MRIAADILDSALVVARAHGTAPAAEYFGLSRSSIVSHRRRVDGYDRGRGHPSTAEMALYPPRSTCFCAMCREWKTERGLPEPELSDLLEAVMAVAASRPTIPLTTAVMAHMAVSRPTAHWLVSEARRQGMVPNVRTLARAR